MADIRAHAIPAASDLVVRLAAADGATAHPFIARLTQVRANARDLGDAVHALCAIHGVGPWTADIFLLFCLGNADAWPVGDLAVQEGARLALGLEARPDPKQLKDIDQFTRKVTR